MHWNISSYHRNHHWDRPMENWDILCHYSPSSALSVLSHSRLYSVYLYTCVNPQWTCSSHFLPLCIYSPKPRCVCIFCTCPSTSPPASVILFLPFPPFIQLNQSNSTVLMQHHETASNTGELCHVPDYRAEAMCQYLLRSGWSALVSENDWLKRLA